MKGLSLQRKEAAWRGRKWGRVGRGVAAGRRVAGRRVAGRRVAGHWDSSRASNLSWSGDQGTVTRQRHGQLLRTTKCGPWISRGEAVARASYDLEPEPERGDRLAGGRRCCGALKFVKRFHQNNLG